MTNKSYLRGYEIERRGGVWVFSDTGGPTAGTYESRPCGHCGKWNTAEGHDGCLGTLPGVMNACCGHGQAADAYVQFPCGVSVRGRDAVKIQRIMRGWAVDDEE
ncbi:hypothetical protein M6D81_11300 [Paenibacillus sp. J5C_2022]|uniref:hypothetical protein n=1 Tax=Paenibacillus sp. J5C2022 TaxID=2977129 RepID=UPI0021CEA385|nr:hypothetical protein [Paenibacillus sp. J5C2022]MCU6709292.1 hypothetical protein [Paenibacillus sp. J5C2022]